MKSLLMAILVTAIIFFAALGAVWVDDLPAPVSPVARVSARVAFVPQFFVVAAPLESPSADVIRAPRSGQFSVCVQDLAIHTGPAGFYPITALLHRGDPAPVEEFGRGSASGWARLGTLGNPGVHWVLSSGICP